MRFVRFGDRGVERPGCIDSDGRIRDLSDHVTSLEGESLDPDSLTRLGGHDHATLPLVADGVRLCKPVRRIGKIIGIGPNYSDSAELAGFKINPEPTLFLKAATAASGPNDPIEIPGWPIASTGAWSSPW